MKLGDSLGRSRKRRRRSDQPDRPGAEPGAAEPGAPEAGASGSGGSSEGGSAGGWRGSGSAPERGPRGIARVGRLSLRDLTLAVAGLCLVGWFFGYTVATRIVFPAPPPPGDLFEVPDLRGLGVASARERLAGAGLDLGEVDSLQHPSVAAGIVLGQSPLPGQVSSPARAVTVTVSQGPQMRAVPDVRRLDRERARVILETSGFVVEFASAESEEPRGRVVRVSPPPDSVVALPAEVRVVVSTGPPVVTMPLVLGLEQREAEALLDSLGLVVADVEEVFRFGRDQGIVVEQQPAADTELERGSGVRLKVGRRGLGREQ